MRFLFLPSYLPSASAGSAQAVEAVDEVIAQHPAPPLSPFAPGSKLAARGPVHTALTASIRSHYPALPAAQHPAESAPGAESDAVNPPTPQVGVIMVMLLYLTTALVQYYDMLKAALCWMI